MQTDVLDLTHMGLNELFQGTYEPTLVCAGHVYLSFQNQNVSILGPQDPKKSTRYFIFVEEFPISNSKIKLQTQILDHFYRTY